MRALAAVVWVLFAAGSAAAQPTDGAAPTEAQVAEARALFDQGVALADQERWGEALEAFRRSLALVRRPSTLYNIGNAQYRLGRHTGVVSTMTEYLRVSDAQRDAARRAEALRMLEISRGSVVALTLRVTPPSAVVTVDGNEVEGEGVARQISLDPGQRAIRVTAEGHQPATLELSVTAGQELERRVELAVQGTRRARIRVTPSVREAITRIDGVVIGEGEVEHDVDPGQHEVRVTAEDHVALRRTIQVTAGENVLFEANLTAEPESGGFVGSPTFWVLTGIVLAGAATGVLVYALSDEQPPYGGTSDVVLMGLRAP